MNKKKKVSCAGIRGERYSGSEATTMSIDDDLDDTMMFLRLERIWRDEPAQMNPLKVLFGQNLTKKDLNELRNMAIRNKEEQPQVMKRVQFLAPEKPRWEIPVDIREKLNEFPLKDFILSEWPGTKFHLDSCRCQFPSHKDKTASFHVYQQTNSFFCFGCSRGGTLVDFLVHNRNMDVKQAISYIKSL